MTDEVEIKPDSAVIAETTKLVQAMASDLILSDVLTAYDAVERALNAANEHHRLLPIEFDLKFRLRAIHESLFKVRADMEARDEN